MNRTVHRSITRGAVGIAAWAGTACAGAAETDVTVSALARDVADYALATYYDSTVATLADLVGFRTVEQSGMANAANPRFQAMTAYLRGRAEALGLDFTDHGAVVVIGLGEASDRLGVVTHGDVQPADPSKWAADPFSLDLASEPGRLIGRGSEDDKGPIATALYAMKAIADRQVPLDRRIELIISYTEESNWGPFQDFLEENPPPGLNVAIDSEYPVVTAEKGFGAIFLNLPADERQPQGAYLATIAGGSFLSQIPEDATAVISGATSELAEALERAATASGSGVRFSFEPDAPEPGDLTIAALGVSAHSSKPWEGRNAITHLAALLGTVEWPATNAAIMVRAINDLVGTGDHAEKFGDVAYSHEFMGPLTLSLTTLGPGDSGGLTAGINIRRPAGRDGREVDAAIKEAITSWKSENSVDVLTFTTLVTDPHLLEDAPHIPELLSIFQHYTGRTDAGPVSIGGGTHARLLPNGVNFGPAMPGEPYTGHSEHEYLTDEQYRLNLAMYTAMLIELAGR